MNTKTPQSILDAIQFTVDADGREHFDDSATRQGRKKLKKRQLGESVALKYMTPQEFRAFQAGIWNGVEMREGAHNWESFNFNTLEGLEKRSTFDRRKEKKAVEPDNRISLRRTEDIEKKEDIVVYLSIISVLLLSIVLWVSLSIYYNV